MRWGKFLFKQQKPTPRESQTILLPPDTHYIGRKTEASSERKKISKQKEKQQE